MFDGFTSRCTIPSDVRLVQRARDVADGLHLLVQRHALRGLAERAALDELHGDVRLALDLADLEHLADARVLDAGLRPRLLEQAQRQARVAAADELERDLAVELAVDAQVDGAHPALAEHGDSS